MTALRSWWLRLLVVAFCLPVHAADFSLAQQAASEGRYKDLIEHLDGLLKGELTDQEKVIAYANRGVAYSLLEAYGKAREDLQLAIGLDPGHALSQNHLGVLAEHVDRDFAAAASWYRKAAEQGFAAAETNLGDLLRRGLTGPADPAARHAEALDWFRKAVAQEFPLAYGLLGLMYRDGLGVPGDPAQALKWFTDGAAHGDAASRFYLGDCHQQGRGTPQDFAKAATYYREAAEQGHLDAQNALGYLYRRGQGVNQDYAEAVAWYRKAADQGHPQAMSRLAWLLATCPDARYCDGAAALELARKAVAADPSASNRDTLAAAEARSGNYDEASRLTRQLQEEAPAGSPKRQAYQERLNLYSAGKPLQL